MHPLVRMVTIAESQGPMGIGLALSFLFCSLRVPYFRLSVSLGNTGVYDATPNAAITGPTWAQQLNYLKSC